MRFENIHSLNLPKIGYGTWRIGNERRQDEHSLAALRTALEIGYTHFDTAEMYGQGRAEEFLGQVIRESGVGRDRLFITSKVMPSHLRYEDILKSCENSLRRLQMDYVDLYLIHWPEARMKLEETFRALNKLVGDGKVKHLGVSNFNVKLLKESQELSETPILTNQVPYSLSDRSYVKNGVLEYCQQNDILFTAYSPVDEGRLYPNQTLNTIASAHNATIHQVALAWVISQPRIITIPMSFKPDHIKENFEAAEITLTAGEVDELDRL
jgi:diketogulonate reductase-like aldo/keto reductase